MKNEICPLCKSVKPNMTIEQRLKAKDDEIESLVAWVEELKFETMVMREEAKNAKT